MMACDITSFLGVSNALTTFLKFIVSFVKEPTAVDYFLLMLRPELAAPTRERQEVSVEIVHSAMEKTVTYAHGILAGSGPGKDRYVEELHVLNAQGVGRFMGLLSTSRLLGVIKIDAEGPLRLGLTRKQPYAFTGNHCVLAKIMDLCSEKPLPTFTDAKTMYTFLQE